MAIAKEGRDPASTATDPLPAPPAGSSGWPWTRNAPATALPDGGGGSSPRISIVVPSYNQGNFIEATLRSVLLQEYENIELIVMDGGSGDTTLEILDRYSPWISYWVSEPDRGQTHAINKGLERATGEIFTYLNSDDLLAPGALAAVADAFRRHPAAGAVHGRCIYIDEAGRELFTRMGRAKDFGSYLRIWDHFEAGDYLTQPEVFCRRERIAEVGPFREELRSVMDFEMWLRLLQSGVRFEPIDVPVAMFRTYAAQKSAVDPGLELCEVVEEYAASEAPGFTREDRAALLRELPTAKAHLLVRAALAATLTGRTLDAWRYCGMALRSDPGVGVTYPFWAALLAPLKSIVPPRLVRAVREAFNRGSG